MAPISTTNLFIYTEGSVLVATNRRGSEDKPLITQDYELPGFMGFNGYLEVTQDGCIPMSEAIYKDAAGGKCFLIIQLLKFRNFHEGFIFDAKFRENKTQSYYRLLM